MTVYVVNKIVPFPENALSAPIAVFSDEKHAESFVRQHGAMAYPSSLRIVLLELAKGT